MDRRRTRIRTEDPGLIDTFTDITGYVLAGGASRRMGTDKRRIRVGGVTLLDKTRRLLERFTGREPFVVGDNLAGFALDASRVLRDASPNCGPMAGLVSAIRHCPTDWCLVLAVDLPGLSTRDLYRLAEARTADLDVITLSKSGHPEPLAAVYHRRRANFWQGCLKEGVLSPIDIIRTLNWKPVLLGAATSALDGVNTPDDLARVAG